MSLKSFLFQKSICITLFLFLVNLCFSQPSEDFFSTSPLYYSDIPLKEGVSEFEEKLAKIREVENREPLGLVLCGGSARAFAHITASWKKSFISTQAKGEPNKYKQEEHFFAKVPLTHGQSGVMPQGTLSER